MLIMNFIGRPALSFTVAMHDENLFEFALEKMQIINELISSQLDSNKLPVGIDSVHYEFDPGISKWKPASAQGNGTLFKYEDNEWVVSNELL